MRIENVDVVELQALEALIEAREQAFARSPLAVGTRAHQIARFRRNDELISVGCKTAGQNAAEGFLCGARRRTVIIGQIEVRDAPSEGLEHHLARVRARSGGAEVLPEPERNSRQLQAAAAAARIGQ